MKVLHTLDWHIGQKFMGKSTDEEHRAFLSWLYEIIKNLYIIITTENTDSPFIIKDPKIQELELALNTLNLLQSSGKIVGVISHVEALKERIPLQIKVVPKGYGTSFVEIN